MLLKCIQVAVSIFAAVQAFFLSKDFIKKREKGLRFKHYCVFWLTGLIINFFDYLGIGSLAPTMATYKLTKTVDDDEIPGTLVVGCVLPVAAEALVSLSIIKVELMTLLGMYGAGILGAVV